MKPKREGPKPDRSADCIRAFLDAAAARLRSHGEVTWQIADFTARGSSKAASPEDVKGLFTATVTLTALRLVSELAYGDKESMVMIVAGPRQPGWHMYGLWEWEAATGRPNSDSEQHSLIHVEAVRRAVDRACTALETLMPAIEAADAGVREIMDGARALRTEAWMIRERDDHHRIAIEKAADAFRARRFAEVVALLEPFADIATPAERARVDYARRHV